MQFLKREKKVCMLCSLARMHASINVSSVLENATSLLQILNTACLNIKSVTKLFDF